MCIFILTVFWFSISLIPDLDESRFFFLDASFSYQGFEMTLSLFTHHIFPTLHLKHHKVFFLSLDPLQQISPPPLLQNHAPESRSKTTISNI
jgi:hypothetical protein